MLVGWLKKLPVIRHVRWAWKTWKFNRWWNKVGRQFWLCPNQADLDYLDNVWNGKA